MGGRGARVVSCRHCTESTSRGQGVRPFTLISTMIARIIEVSLRYRAVVLLGAFALLAAGLWSAFHLPIDAVPDITGVQVQINTEVPALAAEESEKLITQVIEREMAGLP